MELQKKDSIFVKDSAKMTSSMKEIKRNDLMKDLQRLQGWQQESQEIYQTEMQKKVAPIRQKAMDAINAVAKESGYAYVFDINTLIVYPQGDNLLPLVRKKLGITTPAATTPRR